MLDLAKQTNDANAQYYVAWMYDTGKGLIKDRYLALQWYNKAAKQNHLLAIQVLGNKNLFGEAENSTDEKAIEYFTISAEQGKSADSAF